MSADQIRAAVLADQSLRQLAFNGADAELAKRITINEPVTRITADQIVERLGPTRAAQVLTALRTQAKLTSGKGPATAEAVRMLESGGFPTRHLGDVGGLSAQDVADLSTALRNPTADEVSAALLQWRPGGRAHQLVTG